MAYYQTHIMMQEEDGIYRHIPLYFGTTQDRKEGEEHFNKVCAQIFEFEKDVEFKVHDGSGIFGTIKSACGNVTSSFNIKGKYLVELTQSIFKPSTASII